MRSLYRVHNTIKLKRGTIWEMSVCGGGSGTLIQFWPVSSLSPDGCDEDELLRALLDCSLNEVDVALRNAAEG